jgi:hypothetical protein
MFSGEGIDPEGMKKLTWMVARTIGIDERSSASFAGDRELALMAGEQDNDVPWSDGGLLPTVKLLGRSDRYAERTRQLNRTKALLCTPGAPDGDPCQRNVSNDMPGNGNPLRLGLKTER